MHIEIVCDKIPFTPSTWRRITLNSVEVKALKSVLFIYIYIYISIERFKRFFRFEMLAIIRNNMVSCGLKVHHYNLMQLQYIKSK